MAGTAAPLDPLRPLFDPTSVAVIGATNSWSKWGFSTFASILTTFQGPVYPVNTRETEVLGRRAYAKVSDIPGPVDLAVFVVPPLAVREVMRDCVREGVRAGVVITAGFAETGEEGKRLQDEVLAIAREGGLRFIGPNCMGYWSASSDLRAFMFPLPVRPGPIAFVSQGGNVGGAVVRMGYDRGLGFHRYVSCGCTADIQIEDYIEHFGEDPEVKVILAYVEGLGDGVRFIEKVSRVTPRKPVIVLKPGRTLAGAKAIGSHSGALAGSSDLYDSAFKKAGVLRVNTVEALVDVAVAFLTQPLPKGNGLGIITPGGSYGVISADVCASLGLDVVELRPETLAAFDRIFPPRWSRGNPVDPAGDRNFIAYMQAPELLLQLPEVHSVIFMGFDSFSNFGSVFASISAELGEALERFLAELSALAPDQPSLDDATRADWIGRLIQRITGVFFSFFGTSDPVEVEVFGRRLTAFIGKSEVGRAVEERLLAVFRAIREEGAAKVGDVFGQIFRPQMECLVRIWIEAYGKPVITTAFMGQTPSLTNTGHYAYPFAEQAALVVAKLLERARFLDKLGAPT